MAREGWTELEVDLPAEIATAAARVAGGRYRLNAWLRELIEAELHRLAQDRSLEEIAETLERRARGD